MSLLLRVSSPHFVAGLVIMAGRVHRCAPILGYMRSWDTHRVITYTDKKGWTVELLP